ncbi:MAG: dephospho-CoA kinase [Phycisphaerae bacterium]
MPKKKPIIGVSGAVGAGKSQVARIFGDLGGLVIDSDRLNHEVLEDPDTIRTIVGWWPEPLLGPDQRLDRAALARIVFADPEKKRRLESLVYPLIAARRDDMIRAGWNDQRVTAFILDSPLLFESNLDRLCDTVVFVEAGEDVRVLRLKQRRGWDVDELRRREKWQWPPADKRSRAEYTILNEGSIEGLRVCTTRVFDQIIARYAPQTEEPRSTQ